MILKDDTVSHARFGLFEADLKSGELWRSGHRIRLQSLPFRVLTVLLQRSGEVVTREELKTSVWGQDVNVDFEQALASAIKKVREALGDSADNPRFIETLSRRGYRFIAPVTPRARVIPDPPAAVVQISTLATAYAIPTETVRETKVIAVSHTVSRPELLAVVCCLCVVLLATAARVYYPRPEARVPARITQITYDGQVTPQGAQSFEAVPATVTDGERLFTSSLKDGHVVLSQVSIATGEVQQLPLPREVAEPRINDLSPDGSKLLVSSELAIGLQEAEQPLWIVPTNGGSASRVASLLAHAATWMPNGKDVLYANGNQLWVASVDGGSPTLFANVPGRAFWLRWSPDGKSLRFTILDNKMQTSSLWEITSKHKEAIALPRGWITPSHECCGSWTADGKNYVFQATHDGHTDLWKLDGSGQAVQLTNGPINYEAPTASRRGDQIFFVGRESRAEWEVEEYDPRRKLLLPRQDFLSKAGRISFSRDRQWVAWTDDLGHLWRSRTNGTERLLLTPDSLDVLNSAWSPNGNRLALMAHGPREPWQIFTVASSGGDPLRLIPQVDGGIGDPSFAPDGKSLVFGGLPYLMGASNPRPLEIFDFETNHVVEIPHSQGLYTPRWSPDGRYIAALTLDQRKLMLFNVAHQTWTVLVEAYISDPTWLSDSKSLYINTYTGESRPILRVNVPDGRIEAVIAPVCETTATRCFLSGITPGDMPLIQFEIARGNLYSMEFDHK